MNQGTSRSLAAAPNDLGREREGRGGNNTPSDPGPVTRAVAKNIHYKSILYVAHAGKGITHPTTRGWEGELEGVGERGNYYES